MATRIVRKKNTSNVTIKNKITIQDMKNRFRERFWKSLALTVGVTIFICSVMIFQFVLIHNNPNMKDSFLTSAIRFEEKIDKEVNYKVELENEITNYQKEVENLHLDNQNLMNEKVKALVGNIKFFPSYDYSKLSAPKDIAKIIAYQCKMHNFESMDEIYSIVAYESEFNPKNKLVTSKEDSRGLLQVNTYRKDIRKWDKQKIEKLYDPDFNLDFQLNELYGYYILGKSKGLSGSDLACFISRYGQRPAWSNNIAIKIKKYYKEVTNARIENS